MSIEIKNATIARMTTSRQKIKIAIIDYDNTAIVVSQYLNGIEIRNPRPDLLSQILINKIKNQNYAGFYGCTHRCIVNDFEGCLGYDAVRAYRQAPHFKPKNIFTTVITENLSKELKLPALAVSTPDDFSVTSPVDPLHRCGYGYENLIKPYEAQLLQENKELMELNYLHYKKVSFSHPIHKGVGWNYDQTSKNNQIISIINHAKALYPNCDIVLDYFDDVLEICQNAAKLSIKDVLLNVTHLRTARNIDKLICSLGNTKFVLTALNIPASALSTPIRTMKDISAKSSSPSPEEVVLGGEDYPMPTFHY